MASAPKRSSAELAEKKSPTAPKEARDVVAERREGHAPLD
jgi:hypothetical protein